MTQRKDLMNNHEAFGWLVDPEPVDDFIDVMDTDLLIIGAGHAGVAAARSAAETNGDLDIIVIDQQSEEGFKVLGTGEIGHINSNWQRGHDVASVDPAAFTENWQLQTGNRSNYRLIRSYADHCGKAFDWMTEVLSEEEYGLINPMMNVTNDLIRYGIKGQ